MRSDTQQLSTVNCSLSPESRLSTVNCQLSTIEDLRLVIVGHVDHGKSTIIGRLLADTGSLPEGKLERVRETCRRNAKPFEYAFLLDALKDEQAQGITIDAARCFFMTDKRRYIIMDAPGHVEFVKNMVTGASRAEAALLVIDAHEGIRENSRRHGYLLAMLGIRQMTVLVNKMDLVDYRQSVFTETVADYQAFLSEIGVGSVQYIPVSGLEGDNIAAVSKKMPWYQGPTVLAELDRFKSEHPPEEKPFRLPVQGVYKFTGGGDQRRIIAGTVLSGRLHVGDELVFYPSGKRSRVQSLESFPPTPLHAVQAGAATGFILSDQIYVKRGELAVLAKEAKPQTTSRLRCNLFWLGKKPLVADKPYILKLGTAKVKMRLETISRVLDAASLETMTIQEVARHEVAEGTLRLEEAIAFDLAMDNATTGRFVIVDDDEIAGGGIVVEALTDEREMIREEVIRRNYKWEKSAIGPEERAAQYGQQAALIVLTGAKDTGKKPLAKALERQLFNEGKAVYFMGIGNVLYGVDADLKKIEQDRREEHLRRLAEIAHLMLDAGLILLITALDLTQAEFENFKAIVENKNVVSIWVGDQVTTDLDTDLRIPGNYQVMDATTFIHRHLEKLQII